MKTWIRYLGHILFVIGVFGVIKNYNWVTEEQRIALWVSSILALISSIIKGIEWNQKRNSKISKS